MMELPRSLDIYDYQSLVDYPRDGDGDITDLATLIQTKNRRNS